MSVEKIEFLHSFFDQIESQVQFGDTKAALLVAGDAFLLGICGDLIKVASGCAANQVGFGCVVPSIPLGLAIVAATLLLTSVSFALRAILPNPLHHRPPAEFFLLSHIAKSER